MDDDIAISFQPRPNGVNWTAEHALSQGDVTTMFPHDHGMHVEVSDMLHLAAKVAHATCRCQSGQMVDAVTTFTFDPQDGPASVLVREVSKIRVGETGKGRLLDETARPGSAARICTSVWRPSRSSQPDRFNCSDRSDDAKPAGDAHRRCDATRFAVSGRCRPFWTPCAG